MDPQARERMSEWYCNSTPAERVDVMNRHNENLLRSGIYTLEEYEECQQQIKDMTEGNIVSLGSCWSPRCGPYKEILRDCLRFIYWDYGLDMGGGDRIYGFQIVARDESPRQPLNLLKEGIQVEMRNIVGEWAPALCAINPESFIGQSGCVFRVSYPKRRGDKRSSRIRKIIQMPCVVENEDDEFIAT